MAEQTNREKNQAASQQQAQVREQEVTVRGGKFDGLTKRNEDYLFHLDKALDERGMDYEKKNDILETMYQELKKVQKQGYTATKLYGPVQEKAKELVDGPAKKEAAPAQNQKFWVVALDNGLIMFILFCAMYSLMGFFGGNAQTQASGGWLTLLTTLVIAGIGLAYFYTAMLPENLNKHKHKWVHMILSTIALIAVWMVVFYLVALIPASINVVLSPIIYAILAVVGFGVRYYLKGKLGFQRVFR